MPRILRFLGQNKSRIGRAVFVLYGGWG